MAMTWTSLAWMKCAPPSANSATAMRHCQPQADLATGRIVGMEALIRWQHPEPGMVAPNRFIPLAEETGLILPVGAWVLRTACEQLVAWRAQGHEHLRMAVNVSARQMAEHDFVQSVVQVLVISEGVETKEQLAFLRRHGCHQVQGYYFSRPQPAPALADFLRQGRADFGDAGDV